MSAGTLYLVSTPIGNLSDMSFRAIEILKSVSIIAAEDTRHTGLLLAHYEIKNQLTSYHDFNKNLRAPRLIEELMAGKSVAVVCDAGTPGVSDPAYLLVNLAIQNSIEIVPIPGPTAFVAALTVSGLPTDRFVFEGFLPVKSGKRGKRLQFLKDESRTMIFYESPYRVLKTLDAMYEIFGDRRISVSRELTKKFEETKRGKISELKEQLGGKSIKGEFVLVVAGKGEESGTE
ncbi:MAG: 16S rRNA (cytidine(1402)-2'-O)-methyltransferase [candidate division Zixibacteria bacterium RBG_16_48_11]|nr:MAG: 16S rRNA (cytidine(1402)-2'-O)-methyltransferase [candidate division Zixibacteria bacterium RBG_16_48_11]